MTQKPHENEQPSWILTNARTRSSRSSAWTQPSRPSSPATNAAVSSGRRATTVTFAGRPASGLAGEASGAAGEKDPGVAARGARGRLAALRERLVRHAAAVDDRDIGPARRLEVAVREQPLTDHMRIDMRDLAAEEIDAEAHCCGDRTAGADTERTGASGAASATGAGGAAALPAGPVR